MRVLRSFLRPGWLLLAVIVVAFAAACFMILAPWQLGKNSDTEHRNDLLRTAVDTEPVPIDELAPHGAPFDRNDEWREVSLHGTFVPDKQVLLRFRYSNERPAVEILTPFRIAGSDRTILVNRGIVPTGANGQVDVPDPPGSEVAVDARIRKSEGTSPGKEPRVEGGMTTAYTIDTAQLGRLTQIPLEPFYLQLSPNQPGSLGEIELPQLESGPYLSYGLQWLAFGIMVPLGAGYFIYSEVKARRARREAVDAGADGMADGPGDARSDSEVTARSERHRVRQQLRETGARSGNDVAPGSSAVGEGPVADDADSAVRAKLAQRYGK
ncbi:SURF1 family protein [Gordonia zhaorongruii]|uniref:SURF1 family cytochrome oxidase biogenesis protein n=1 Tax=Gordonia zhaorongruii TaxID=2597659 RepID=UPI00117EFFA9|nr:SURF1 family cytochrome oxidase biogenesis protein [Gordonia zhaorongruii]